MAALVLRAKTARNGNIKRLDVVRAGELTDALEDIKEGEYTVLDGSEVKEIAVSYRTVQDVEYK